MDRTERPVDKHLDRDARGRVETFHLRRSAGARELRFVEVADQRIGCNSIAGEKRIPAVFHRPRLRRLHLQPTRPPIALVEPRVPDARADQSEIARTKRTTLPANLRYDASFQNVKAFLKGMHVRLNDAAWIEEANAHTHMHRTHCAVHVGRAPETRAVLGVERRRLRGGFVDFRNVMHAGF